MAPASEPVRLERLPAFAWAVIAVVGLSVLCTVVQVMLVRPYLWPAGTGATLAGDPTALLPLKARPPDVAVDFVHAAMHAEPGRRPPLSRWEGSPSAR